MPILPESPRRSGSAKKSEDELERDAYFNDPANADEIAEMFARMELR